MNPSKAADVGVSRSAVEFPDDATTSNSGIQSQLDWTHRGAFASDMTHGAGLEVSLECAIVLVDPDSAHRAGRKARLTAGGGARVILASDEFDVADAMRLMDPDVVIVSASDGVLGGKLIRAVRAQFDAHHEPVPILAWQSRLVLQGTAAELLDAGADAVLAEDTSLDEVLATARALRRVMATASRRSSRELAPTVTVLDTLPVSVALIDRDGRVRDANMALQLLWREMTGQRVCPVGSDLAQLLVPTDGRTFAEAIASLFGAPAGSVTDLECSIGVSPLRGIPVHLRLVRLEDSAPEPMVVVHVTDLREQRRTEELLRSNRWRALDRQQMLDLTGRLRGLLSAVSQSLGTLAGLRAGGDMMLSSTHLSMLRGTLAQGEQLVDGMQAIAEEQEHPAALVDVHTLVDTHLELFRQMLPKHITLTWDAGVRDLLVRASESQLQQVLTSLVMNAWDAQRSGGAIHVSVRHSDDSVVIAVEDQGPGVPEEQADWIFLPMTTTRAAEGASGLGLVNARRAVEMHGGQLRLDRGREVGARFEVILPRYRSRTRERKPQVVPPRRFLPGR